MTSATLRGKKVLITAGPTREYWDPVRYLTNNSSGAMGFALAKEARRLGARVTLILGPVPDRSAIPSHLKRIDVISAWDMYQAVKRNVTQMDYVVGAAAVVDYRPAGPLKLKFKRQHPSVTLKLQGNPDIIAMVGHLQKNRPRQVVGFALETDHVEENALQKLARKRLDWIVANRETNMGGDSGSVTILSRWGHRVRVPQGSKEKLAKVIWQTITTSKK